MEKEKNLKGALNSIMKNKKMILILSLIAVFIAVIVFNAVYFAKNKSTLAEVDARKNAENQIALSYGTADASTNSEYVQFSTFFTRDVNGKAEKLAGTCKNIAERDTLFLDINVLSDGYLEDGAVITVEDANFTYKVNAPADEVLKNNVISDNASSFTLNKMNAGTQKLIQGEISADLGNNVDNYTKEVTVKLVGTHVSNDGVRTPINVEKKVTVDWYGDLETEIFVYKNYSKEENVDDDSIYYYFNDFKKSIDSETNTETPAKNSIVTVSFSMDEIKKELLLKENSIDIIIPSLNGKAPEKVKCINSDVSIEKVEDTENGQKYRLTKTAIIGNDDVITKKLADENTYTISIKYPEEAYEAINDETTLNIDVQGYYIAYNNPNEELNLYKDPQIAQNESKSNVANKIIKVVFKKYEEVEHGSIDFGVTILDKKYSEMKNSFVISKETLAKWFDDEESTEKFEYKVEWDAIVKGENQNSVIKMSEGQAEVLVGEENQEKPYGDTFNQNVLEKYIVNNGLYFENVEEVLGAEGSISIYNNNTNELIRVLTVEEAKTYTAENPLMFGDEVKHNLKHIRIETSTVVNTEIKVLKVVTLKEINKDLFKEDYTKADVEDIEVLNTVLEGTLQSLSVADESSSVLTVRAYDSVHLYNKTSYAEIEVETKQISTARMLEHEKIFIKTLRINDEFDSSWKNGRFVVEIPEEIAGIAINSITADNGVSVESWDLSEIDGRNVLKIKTVNDEPTLFTITVDCDVTPDYKINSTTKQFKLYYYNELANRYYKLNEDIYDVNENTSAEENVGLAVTDAEFISAQELITFETISNYKKADSDSDEWLDHKVIAPEIALVDNNESLATINVVLKNGYKKSINNIKVLGRIPFEGNKNIISQEDLASAFTVNLSEKGIAIPAELQDSIEVYYSTNENADIDLTKEENGWKKAEDFTNKNELATFMNNVKSYFIDFKEAELEGEKEYVFSYEVAIPETVECNLVSYSNHTVYYNVETSEGTLTMETSPAKVGMKIVRRFDLNITTYDEKDGTILKGVEYTLTWKELDKNGRQVERSTSVKSDENGSILISNLIEGTEYKLKQTKSPEGYMDNYGTLTFKAVNDEYGNLQVISILDDGLVRMNAQTQEKDIIANDRNVSIGVENKQGKEFSIYKIDEENSNPIQDVLFDIYEIDNNLNQANKVYSNIKTDADGKATVWLAPGLYKAVETNATTNYQLPADLEDKTRYFEIKANDVETDFYPVNTIEDLVEVSRLVNSGDESIKNKTIKLMRNLDFKSDSSYRKYEDKNTLEELKMSLLSGNGFTPIGNRNNPFTGTFDGNGYEIRNIYIHTNGDVGLFGYAVGAQIKNVRLTGGTIIDSSASNGFVAGIVGCISDNGNQENVNIISNCYNSATINGGQFVAGIVGQALGKVTIANCNNAGDLTSYAAGVGGIVGMANPTNDGSIVNCSVLNCYNTGKLLKYNGGASGIAINFNCGQIINCYNLGELSGSTSTGICGGGSSVTVKDCYYLSTTAEKGSNTTQDAEGIIESKTLEEINNITFANILNQNIENIESELPLQTWYGKENTNPKFVEITDSVVMTNTRKEELRKEYSESWNPVDDDYYAQNIVKTSIIIKNSEIYKIDEETGKPVRNVLFYIFKTDENYNNPVFVESLYTGSNGTAILNVKDGYYKAVEISVPSGYILEENEEDRTTYFQVKTTTYVDTDSTGTCVGYIEDLIEIAENVNTGKTTYEGKTIYLLRDLDMDSRDSYRNPDAQSKYDFNKNGTIETIWDELHTEGYNYGLIPIGKGPYFHGNFDGCGHSLINFKIGQGESTTGLFGCIQNGSVVNIEIKGNTIVNGNGYGVGTIVGQLVDGRVENCCSYASTGGNIVGAGSNFGGIVGLSSGKTVIKNCFNAKDITINSSGGNYGGILGYGGGEIINCYNIGNITVEQGSNLGGICGGSGSCNIVNCYNEGEIIGKYQVAGICGDIGNNSKILNSYNKGHIKALTSPAAGIYNGASNVSGLEINNNYNMGLVEFNINRQMANYISQITPSGTGANIQNCYYALDKIIDYQQNGTGLSRYYMQSNDFVTLLNNNQQTIDTDYTLSKWVLTNDGPTLENVGVISRGVDINKDYTYNISTANELREFASKINTGEITGNVKVVLTNDINLGNQEFTPIGTASNPFNGTFEGNGYVIEGLYISCIQYGSPNYAGLFGVVESGSINKLGVKGKIVISQNSSSAYVGGLIGVTKIKDGKELIVNNCYSEVDMDVNTLAGGLIGLCASGDVSIYNSYNAGSIRGSYKIAGIVGFSAGKTTIVNCYNSGNLSGIYLNMYGIAEGNSSNTTVENCINVGTLTADQGYGNYYGLAGTNTTVYNSYYLAGENYTTSQKGITKTAQEMQSKEFWQLLNDYVQRGDSSIELKTWKYNAGSYPTLGLTKYVFKDDKYLQILNRHKNKIEITKVDEETGREIEAAEFKIETAEEVNSYSVYPHIGEMQKVQNFLEFTERGNMYVSANQGSNTAAFALFEIDLTGIYDSYTLQYDASVAGATNCYGYTYLNNTGNLPSSSEKKLSINGNTSGTHSISLTANRKNYFFIVYSNNGGLNNTFKVGNMKLLYNRNVIDDSVAYSSKISGDKIITIDLTNNVDKKYFLEFDASISSKENSNFGYVLINESSYPFIQEQEAQAGLIYMSGDVNNKIYRTELEGGKRYYVHVGNFIKDYSNVSNEEFKIKSIKLKKISERTVRATIYTEYTLPGDTIRITEIKSPDGYINGNYTETMIPTEDISITVTNKKDSLFTINKVDEETNNPIQGAKFVVYKVSAAQEVIEQAKYSNGNYVGTLEDGLYVVTTDSNGQIKLNLPEGFYKAVEVQPANGYVLEKDENLRTIYFEIEDTETQSQTTVDTNCQEGTIVNISTIDDLKTVAEKVNSGEDDYEGKTLKLMNDLNNIDENLITIGKNNTFRGNFDGNNHTIRNIDSTTENGLFGKIENSYIKNLTVENANFKTTDAINGGLIAEAYNSTIENIRITGENSIEGIGIENYGTVVGYADNSTINKCSNERNIVINNTDNYALKNVAGLVGKGSNVKIIECNNSGAISSGNGGTSNVNLVGIVGNIIDAGLIENCTNTGNIIATTGEYSSGIIGGTSENVTVKNCHNQAEIKSNSGSNGIAYILKEGTITNCDNTGLITSGNPTSGILYRLDDGTIKNCHNSGYINCFGMYASGIVYQLNDSKVRDCYNEGKIETNQNSSGIAYEANSSKIIDCYNKGELTKAPQIAGIVSYSKANSIILNCYNDAVINVANSNATGIAFSATDSIISNCHNNKDISAVYPVGGIAYTITRTKVNDCYNTAKITSNVPAGGIVYSANDNSIIVNCYNTGAIKSTTNSVGGLVNTLSNSKIYNCYNKGNVTSKGDSTGTSAGGILYSMNGTCEIANCYNSGTITTETENANTYSLAYKGSTNYFKNCYYLEGTANYAVETDRASIAGNYEKITETKLKSELFVEQLNQNKISLQNEIGIPLCNWSLDEVPTLVSNNFIKDNKATLVNRRESNVFYIIKKDAETGKILNGSEFAIWKFEKELNSATTIGGSYNADSVDKIEINLTNIQEDVLLKVNASQSKYSNCVGNAFAIITDNREVPDYKNCKNPFILLKGEKESSDYYIVLKGGKKYYMHIGTYAYSKRTYTGMLTIGNISLYKQDKIVQGDLGANRNNKISVGTTYSRAYENDYFTIDLADAPMYEQYYRFNTNVAFEQQGMSPVGEAYCIITESSETPDYRNSSETFFKLDGKTEEKNYSVVLERGKRYYVHIGLYAKPGETNTGVLVMKDNSLNVLNTYTDSDCLITENKAPNGYIKSNDVLYLNNKTAQGEILATNKKAKSYAITKIDEDTNQPIKGAKFAIYKVDNNLEKIENVVDINSNHAPENYNDLYVYTTDENGQITISLPEGLYKAVEVAPTDGYLLSDDEESRSVYFNIDEDIPGSIKINKQNTQTFEINYIEDLIELSNRVNLGETFEGVTVELKRDLDFKDKNSYMSTKTDEEKNNLINRLTSTTGFIRIGSESSSYGYDMGTGYIVCKGNSFKGTFDGNNKKISNLYLKNGDACIGLFGQIEDACVKNLIIENPSIITGTQYCGLISKAVNSEIKNIKIIGNNTISFGGTNSGVLVGYSENCTISSCSNEINVDMYSNVGAGTIVGSAVNSKIISSHNSGQITNSGYNLGGIVGSATNNSIIKDCYNAGMISGSGTVGGIVYKIADSDIINCYNSGELNGSNSKAGIAYNVTNTNMTNCYNNGKITNGVCSGIVFEIKNSKLVKCHNDGEMDCSSGAGLGYQITDCLILDCYNKGNLKGSPICGIGYSINNSKIVKTHNEGKISGGYCSGFGCTITNVVMDNCYNSGIVDSTGDAAGIANRLSGQINKTYNIANITGATKAQGIAYQIEGTITNVYNKGNITSSGGPANGIALELNGTLKNAYNEGNIQSRVDATGIVRSGTIENCVNTGNIKVTNTGSCAGIVITVSNVKNCYNLGKIECDYTTEDMKAETFASGIAQKNDGAEIINCYYLDTSAIQGIYGEEDVPGSYEKITQADIESGVIANEINQIKSNCEQSSYRLIRYQEPVTNRTNSDMEYTLIVHHYLDNTEDKLEEDSVSTYHGGSNYSVEPSQELLKKYDLVKVVGHEEGNINEDTEVSYYYKLKEHTITTKVEIPEGRTEKGGTISGDITIEGNNEYEDVKHDEDSTKDIIITPDAGYRVKEIRLVSTDASGKKNEIVVYGENADNTSEIKARLHQDGSITMSKFTGVTEDKEIIVVFEPNEGTVLVHHYIENTTEKLSRDEITTDLIGTVVETNPVNKERYVLVSGPEGEERIPTIDNTLQQRTYYYQLEHHIITDVIEHDELYVDKDSEGNITERNEKNIKGGNISGEDEEPYEAVIRYRDNTKKIEVTPSDGYEIISVTINDEVYDYKGIAETNDKVTFDENGKLTLDEAFFTSMEEDKDIKVSFKKKSKVIVKYLEEETGKVLYKTPDNKDFIEITGVEGDDFSTEHKIIPGYKDSTLGITDEDGIDISDYSRVQIESNSAKGNMYANEITIIYWYKRIESKAIERHIEINEKGEVTELANREFNGFALDTKTTSRMNFGDDYISVDGPENSSQTVTVVGKDEDSKEVTLAEEGTNEVWYYYEKQFKVTTEVKPHIEKDVDENDVEVDGGTISKEYKTDENGELILDEHDEKIEIPYEIILNRGDSTKEIVIKPDDLYRIKSITINDIAINLDNFTKAEDGSITLPEKYFEDVREDKHIVVEFEKIPAKVIVKYLDSSTGEELIEDKIIEGYINDSYNEQRVEVEGYIPDEPEPDNNVGNMTEDTITVIYYYTKEFIITTDVKEHEEYEGKSVIDILTKSMKEIAGQDVDDNDIVGSDSENDDKLNELRPKVQVKGGSITGELTPENEDPVEVVNKGKDNEKEIVIKPDENYRVKSITVYEGNKNENGEYTGRVYEIDIDELIEIKKSAEDTGSDEKDNTIIIPAKYFTNMQSDKHIVVEFEKIPSKVIVNYKEKATEKDVAEQLIGIGTIGDEYITHEQEIPYYELLKDELPENAEGVMVEEDTIVTYWYRRFLFNMKLEKEFSSIQINGKEVLGDNNEFARVEIKNTELNKTNITVKYKVTVTNTEEIAGTAKVIEQIPVGFKFVNSEDDGWVVSENSELNVDNGVENGDKSANNSAVKGDASRRFELTTRELQPGESAEYEVVLEWDRNAKIIGNLDNIARIVSTENGAGFDEETLEDNQDSCMLVVSIKTGQDRKWNKIISIACFVLAGVCTIAYVGSEVYYRKKNS